VERTSLRVILAKMEGASADGCGGRLQYRHRVDALPACATADRWRLSMTYDADAKWRNTNG
jgi:hypothetical protein